MLEVDFHCHSLFSTCGLHTIIELLTYAKSKGLKALAVTDHGTAQDGRISSPFFDRLVDPVEGIRLLKGQECNIVDDHGRIDFPLKFLLNTDIVLVGLHPNLDKLPRKADYTGMVLKALEKNPFVDILTHLNDTAYPVDYEQVIAAAKMRGMAIEFNNSKTLYGKVPPQATARLIDACKRAGCRAVIDSDAHALHEIGLDDSIRPLLKAAGFPRELIINDNARRAFDFIEERRAVKREFLQRLNLTMALGENTAHG
jgi:putative hydrolase